MQWHPTFWLILIFNGCIAAGLGWLVWLHLLSRLAAGSRRSECVGDPAVALICAWLQLGDVPSLAEWVGVALIAIALGLLATMSYRLQACPHFRGLESSIRPLGLAGHIGKQLQIPAAQRGMAEPVITS